MRVRRILLLLFVNIVPAVFGVLCYEAGFLTDSWMALLTPCILCVNYKFTAGAAQMVMWDVVCGIAAAAEIIVSSVLYQENVSADAEGIMVAQLFFAIWLSVYMFFLLGTLTWRFHRQGREKPMSMAAGFLALWVLFVGVAGYLSVVPGEYEYADVYIENTGEIVCDGRYEGEIKESNAVIRKQESGEEIKVSKKTLGMKPSQMALGEEYCYVLGGRSDTGNNVIVKLTYDGKKVSEHELTGYTEYFTCKSGVLFRRLELPDEEDTEENWLYDSPGHFFADQYLPEADFEEGTFTDCKADENGVCDAAGVTLYQYGNSFSTNPPLESYQGANSYVIAPERVLEGEEQTPWTELVLQMLEEKGLRKYTCQVEEYQDGRFLYGVIHVRQSVLWCQARRLRESIAYRIDCDTNKITVLAQLKRVFMVIADEECVIYEDGGKLTAFFPMQGEKPAGTKIELGKASTDFLYVCGDYISTGEEDKVKWR